MTIDPLLLPWSRDPKHDVDHCRILLQVESEEENVAPCRITLYRAGFVRADDILRDLARFFVAYTLALFVLLPLFGRIDLLKMLMLLPLNPYDALQMTRPAATMLEVLCLVASLGSFLRAAFGDPSPLAQHLRFRRCRATCVASILATPLLAAGPVFVTLAVILLPLVSLAAFGVKGWQILSRRPTVPRSPA